MHSATTYLWAIGGIFVGVWAYAYASNQGIV